MALTPRNNNPVNIQFPMRRGTQGAFATNDSTIDAVIDDLRILLLTNHGERPIHFDFGANLRPVLFDQGPDIPQRVEDSIVAAVEKWMPFINLKRIEVTTIAEDASLRPNEVRVKISFSVGQLQGNLEQRVNS